MREHASVQLSDWRGLGDGMHGTGGPLFCVYIAGRTVTQPSDAKQRWWREREWEEHHGRVDTCWCSVRCEP